MFKKARRTKGIFNRHKAAARWGVRALLLWSGWKKEGGKWGRGVERKDLGVNLTNQERVDGRKLASCR